MSQEAIEEYLAIAHYCVTTAKANGGVYGYPLFCCFFLSLMPSAITPGTQNTRLGQ